MNFKPKYKKEHLKYLCGSPLVPPPYQEINARDFSNELQRAYDEIEELNHELQFRTEAHEACLKMLDGVEDLSNLPEYIRYAIRGINEEFKK